jgi:hypothetical protein
MRTKKSVIQTKIKERVKMLTDLKREALIAGVEADGRGETNLADKLYSIYDEIMVLIEQAPKYLKTRTKYREVSDYDFMLWRTFSKHYLNAAALMDMPVYMDEWKEVRTIKRQCNI